MLSARPCLHLTKTVNFQFSLCDDLQDDLWRPMNHVNKVMLKKFVEEMKAAGVTTIEELVYGE